MTHVRKPRYLSPSALSAWREDRDQYVLKYLVEGIPKIPQNAAMAVGSSFDAYIKNTLGMMVLGEKDQFDELFTSQVEEHNRDQALKHGGVCYNAYKDTGALDSLVKLLHASDNVQILFEKKDEGVSITHAGHTAVILGYADLTFSYKGLPCVLDWKVNGFMSKYGASPKQGHMDHKDCIYGQYHDLSFNEACHLETVEPSWATQLSTYSWLGGLPIGHQFMAMIDQLACSPKGIKVAKHRGYVSEGYQGKEFVEYARLWSIVQSDHVFRELSPEESVARFNVLASQVEIFNNPSEKHQWLKKILRG